MALLKIAQLFKEHVEIFLRCFGECLFSSAVTPCVLSVQNRLPAIDKSKYRMKGGVPVNLFRYRQFHPQPHQIPRAIRGI